MERLKNAEAIGSVSHAAMLLHQELKAEANQENMKDSGFPYHTQQKVRFIEFCRRWTDLHYTYDKETDEKIWIGKEPIYKHEKGQSTGNPESQGKTLPSFPPTDSEEEDDGGKEKKTAVNRKKPK